MITTMIFLDHYLKLCPLSRIRFLKTTPTLALSKRYQPLFHCVSTITDRSSEDQM